MSRTHDIDNEESLFQMDADESLRPNNYLAVSARRSQAVCACTLDVGGHISALHASPTWDQGLLPTVNMGCSSSADSKGKGVSQPVSIIPKISDDDQAMFSMSLGSSSTSLDVMRSPPPTSFPPTSVDSPAMLSPVRADSSDDDDNSDTAELHIGSAIAKGKAREQPPTLPPLSFLQTEFSYNALDWPALDLSSSIPGSSSLGSAYGSPDPAQGVPTVSSQGASPEPPDAPFAITRVPLRRRSLSALSVRSNRSLSALSMSKEKVKVSGPKAPGNLARKLLFSRKREGSTSTAGPSATLDVAYAERDTVVSGCADLGQTNCLIPWSRDLKLRTPPLATTILEVGTAYVDVDSIPMYYAGRSADNSLLRTKGRSYSSPLPLPSTALDLVPVTTADIFAPIPAVTPLTPNHFDDWLPRELRLHILAALVNIHDADHRRYIQDNTWSVLKATSSRNKWVGRDKGLRELFKLSRVSKAWQGLAYDGQLWTKLDLRSFPRLPTTTLLRLSRTAGAFIRELDLTGHADISSTALYDISLHLSIPRAASDDASCTNLTYIDLHGCTALTTRSLHYLLQRSPEVRTLRLKGLAAVTNATCEEVLANHCPNLVSLDLSRCSHLTGDGIKSLADAALARNEPLRLKELRLSGLKRVTDEMMAALGKVTPALEVLELSYSRHLHNSAIEAFVACEEKDAANFEVIQLTAREAGRDSTDTSKYWRRVTRLRHLNISSCSMLTDHACSHLAYAVPKLELLELAGIGENLRDDGLVRLLKTTPFIRKLDLEDASDITDNVLDAITPVPIITPPAKLATPTPPQPGHALEHLTISYAGDVTNEALMELVQNCPRLHVLEADNTRMSGTVVKEFVHLARARQLADARISAIDCRGVGEYSVKDLVGQVRPRLGWRGWGARKLGFLDARDEEGLGIGQDECDPLRVVLKTFYSWQTVDAVRAAREKKRKAAGRRSTNSSGSSEEAASTSVVRTRWWTPGGRRSGAVSPAIVDM
ncbi:hypothetical protein CERSUDRAFT_79884, partial [Gelatoporia subvermispora B]